MTNECEPHEKFETVRDIVCWSLGRITSPFDSQDLIKELLSALREVTGSARVDLLLYQSDMNILFFSESVTDEEESKRSSISLTDSKNSAPVQALAGGHTVLVDDVRESGLLSLSSGTRTLLAVPVFFCDRAHGVLSLEHVNTGAFDTDNVQWIEALSSIFAVLLEQSYLSETLFNMNQKLIDLMTDRACETDPNYREHAARVSNIAVAIAEELKLDPDSIQAVRDSGYLHDIGKSGMSQNILVKPGSLTSEEFDEVKKHPILGRFLLKPLGFQPAVIEGVASHHERWDGKGYPRGLSGREIPITGRILAVAEAYDVMTSDQPYKKKMAAAEAVADLKNHAGNQFDPEVVDALLRLEYGEF
jgi:putative nucleotidyltransferase with HDIG domain